jgi:hypothetical protein
MITDLFGREFKLGQIVAHQTKDNTYPTIGVGIIDKIGKDYINLRTFRVASDGDYVKSDRVTIKRIDRAVIVNVSREEFFHKFDQAIYDRNKELR